MSRRRDSGLGGLKDLGDSIGAQLRGKQFDSDQKLLEQERRDVGDVSDEDTSETLIVKSTKSTSTKKTTYTPPEPEERIRRTREPKELVEVEPPYDKDGTILSIEDIETALMELAEREDSIDEDAKLTAKDKEQQANRVRNLHKQYKTKNLYLSALLRQAKQYAQYQRDLLGYRDYGLGDEHDEVISKLMDSITDDFFDEVDHLKDVVAKRLREGLDTLPDEANAIIFRERLYRELHTAGVMGNWEPMEF